jgi:hypothetical protein
MLSDQNKIVATRDPSAASTTVSVLDNLMVVDIVFTEDPDDAIHSQFERVWFC